jgi:hypothetical protein
MSIEKAKPALIPEAVVLASKALDTIDGAQSMGPVRGSMMRPFLKKIFYGINFTPFIEEAERREKAARA